MPTPQGPIDPIVHGVKIFVPGTKEAKNAGNAIVGAGKHVEKGIEGIGKAGADTVKFFEKLLDPHFWVRVGEVLVGSILLIVGVDHMFNTDFTNKAAKLAPALAFA